MVPAVVGGDEALGRGGAGVDHGVAVEAAEASLAAGGRVADGFHRPCSVRSTLSALMARGMPVYGAVWRMASSMSESGTSIARSASMWAATCGSELPRPVRSARMMSSRSRGAEIRAGVDVAEDPVDEPGRHRLAHPIHERLAAGVVAQLLQALEAAAAAVVGGVAHAGAYDTVPGRGGSQGACAARRGAGLGPARGRRCRARLGGADRGGGGGVPRSGRADQDHRDAPDLPQPGRGVQGADAGRAVVLHEAALDAERPRRRAAPAAGSPVPELRGRGGGGHRAADARRARGGGAGARRRLCAGQRRRAARLPPRRPGVDAAREGAGRLLSRSAPL